ncbi:hypothetical protein BS50DRAFT_589372 [Corynespora cassiicola Philippines]|uniref:Uncharacterized protein n=1 Tax=Corynespora cassiicola Philippines TaxID=1448308 RepID=A0A2T2NI16_CORCC|nr:hypothetical protein BS50DRAFT_589372 [Corynespora cassiicola Philippines]
MAEINMSTNENIVICQEIICPSCRSSWSCPKCNRKEKRRVQKDDVNRAYEPKRTRDVFHPVPVYPTNFCNHNPKYMTKHHLNSHMPSRENGWYRCLCCPMLLKTQSHWEDHVFSHARFRCDCCEKYFRDQNEAKRHRKKCIKAKFDSKQRTLSSEGISIPTVDGGLDELKFSEFEFNAEPWDQLMTYDMNPAIPYDPSFDSLLVNQEDKLQNQDSMLFNQPSMNNASYQPSDVSIAQADMIFQGGTTMRGNEQLDWNLEFDSNF